MQQVLDRRTMGVCSFSGHLVENNNDGRGLAYLFVFALLFFIYSLPASDRVSCNPGRPQTDCVAEVGPASPERRDARPPNTSVCR